MIQTFAVNDYASLLANSKPYFGSKTSLYLALSLTDSLTLVNFKINKDRHFKLGTLDLHIVKDI